MDKPVTDKPVKYKLVSSEKLQYFMRENMFNDEYSMHKIWKVYSDIMSRSLFIEKYKKMTQTSLEKRLNEWASVKGGWLIRRGKGKDAVYYKRWCQRSDKSRAEILGRVTNTLNKLRSIRWKR